MNVAENIIEFIFGSALFINAFIFIPQAIKIFREKTARGVSLFTFIGFLLIQFAIILHGVIHRDYLLIFGYILSMLTCGAVVFLALIYRKNRRGSNDISFEDILEQLPGHIYWKDRDGVCLGCNKNNWVDFGLKSLADFIGKTDYDVFSKEHADKIRMADKEVISSGKFKVFEEEVNIDGKRALYLSHKAPLRDKHSKIIGILGTSVDITASKQAVLDEFKMLENIIAIMPGHVYWMDRNGTYLGCNDNQARSVGFNSRKEIIGKRNTEIRGFLIPEILDPINEEVMAREETIVAEEPAVLHGGTEAIFLSTKAPLYSSDHEVTGMVGISIDITDLKRMEKEAERLRLKSEAQEIKLQEQDRFRIVAEQVAHDIRSPLASLSMIVGACSNLPESERISLREVSLGISNIINNLLERYKKIEKNVHGEVENTQYIPVSLALLEILSEKKYQYKNLQVSFNDIFDPETSFVFIKIDPSNFNRMISNIVNNSVEAFEGRKGEVDLRLSLSGEQVKITIQDDGKGMPQEILDKIMSNVVVTNDKKGGSGLGFVQVRDTLQSGNGQMLIESEIGNGTRIILTFPKVMIPDWIAEEINLCQGDTLIVLDDDTSIHEAWKIRFGPRQSKIQLQHFKLGEEAANFVNSLTPKEKEKIFLLSDFELIDQKRNGLQIIEDLNMEDRSILVTSHHANLSVRDFATKLGVKVLPKQLASDIPINIEDSGDNKEMAGCHREVDVVVIDDNRIFADSLASFFQSRSLKADVYYNPKKFLENLSQYLQGTKIFIDNYFRGHITTGVELAKQLNAAGYKRLYMLSGSNLSDSVPDYLTVIVKGDMDALEKFM